jgi:hypothetical protein
MATIFAQMKWIMLTSGLLTLTMVQAAISPGSALQSTFGGSLEGPLAEVVVRNWGALIALVGGMLIYGAYQIAVRPLVLTVAAASKIVFIILVLMYGFAQGQAAIAIGIDAVMVLIFTAYLLGHRRTSSNRSR